MGEHLSIFSQRILDGLEYAVPLGDLASVRNYLIDMLGN